MRSADKTVGRFRRHEGIGPTPILPKTATQQWGNTSTESKTESSLSTRSVFESDTASISQPYVTHLPSTDSEVITERPTTSLSVSSDDGELVPIPATIPTVPGPARSGNSTATTSTPDDESLGLPVTFPRITFIRSSHYTVPRRTRKSWYPTGTMPAGTANGSFTNSSSGPTMTLPPIPGIAATPETPLPTCSGTSQSDVVYETSTTTVGFTITATGNITVAPITLSPPPLCPPSRTPTFLTVTEAFSLSLFHPPLTEPGAPPPEPSPEPAPTNPFAAFTSTIIVTKVSPLEHLH